MSVHLVNPSDISFGTAVITPRWLYVLAAATPAEFGTPVVWDETLEEIDFSRIQPGDVVGIGIHTLNARRGYAVGRKARERGAKVVFGGIHASLFPDESLQMGLADAVVKGDGEIVWGQVLSDCASGLLQRVYEGGRVEGDALIQARWDLIPRNAYFWASVQTLRGCPKHCSFCSVWRTDGQKPRDRSVDLVVEELVELRRRGFRMIALADDNFYPVSLTDLQLAERQSQARLQELRAIRQKRFDLMARLAELPGDMYFFTQITMEAAEDPEFLTAMRRARILGVLVGVEAVTAEGLKSIHKTFNFHGEALVERLRHFRRHGIHVLGSFIFGLPTDQPQTFALTAELAEQAEISFAQFVLLTPFVGTTDFDRWERANAGKMGCTDGIPHNRYWLLPPERRPKLLLANGHMSMEEMLRRTQEVWDRFYSLPNIWRRSRCATTLKARLAFVVISKLYRHMYANTGIATDSARRTRASRWARWLAKPCRRLFHAKPMPGLSVPVASQQAEPLA